MRSISSKRLPHWCVWSSIFIGLTVLLSVAVAQAQTAGGRSAAPAPAPARRGPSPSPAAPSGGDGSKGIAARVTVTPQYKAEFQKEIRLAVVAAPSYRGSGLSTLQYTFVDALELKAELERQGFTVLMITPAEGTADNLRKALHDTKQLLDGNNQGTLLFAFSGHGFQSGKENYLMTVGATPESVEKEGLSVNDVLKLMDESGARRKLVFVDACRNDPGAKATNTPRTFAEFTEAEGVSVMLSTRPGGFSYEDPDLGHGVFTYYVLDGLRGKAAGPDGYVTFFDLQRYVETNVMNYALKKRWIQRPFVMGERTGDFLLATAPRPKPEELPKMPEASSQVNSDTLVLRQVGGEKAYFGLMSGTKLTLVDALSLRPYVELQESEKQDLSNGYRHFQGNTNSGELFDAAVQTKGSDVVGLTSRIGKACPKETACSTPGEVPPLPGEAKNDLRDKSDKIGKAADGAQKALSRIGIGRASRDANKTAVGADTTKTTLDQINPLLQYKWTLFSLTSNLPGKTR